MEKELYKTTLFPRKALRPMSLARLDNLFVYDLIIISAIGKSRKFTVPSDLKEGSIFCQKLQWRRIEKVGIKKMLSAQIFIPPLFHMFKNGNETFT